MAEKVRRMHILWQNEHYPDVVRGGGGAVNTYYIVRSLTALGHKPLILSRGPDGVPAHREDVNGTPVLRLPPPMMPSVLWPLWPILEPRYVARALAAFVDGAQLLVCTDPAYAVSFKKLCPTRPLIIRVEGTDRGHDTAAPPRRPRPRRLRDARERLLRRTLGAAQNFVETAAWRRGDALVVKSEFMKRELNSLYAVPTDRIHVIANGVDFDRYAAARVTDTALAAIRNGESKVVVTFCGRLVRCKNLSFLLNALATMRFRDRCVLVIIGDGEERAALEVEARELHVGDHVRFLGHRSDVECLLATSDIFVLPSTYETFGNALLEAMAAGLPCVALRPDFIRVRTAGAEIIRSGETGYLVDASDPRDLAHKLDILVAEPSLRRGLGQAGRALCKATYSWSACAASYANLASTLADQLDGSRSVSP